MSETECNGCGSCCDPVSLAWSQGEVASSLPGQIQGLDARTRRWVLHELVPLTRREGLAKAPWLKGTRSYSIDNGRLSSGYAFLYRCRNFDPETRRCAAYADRPTVCQIHPTYGVGVREGMVLPPTCSYRADLGQPVEPMPAGWVPIDFTRRTEQQ